jgi:uncharacterized OsmC-like protein
MATIKTVYQGSLRTKATHIQSGVEIITDAPLDNHGKGESFSPTDLMSASLASCMLTIMGIAANGHDFSIDGAEVEVTKIMNPEPRKVKEIQVKFKMPQNNYTDSQKRILEKAAHTCPVALSLHPDLHQNIEFLY